jgi:hypothetical protein
MALLIIAMFALASLSSFGPSVEDVRRRLP